MNTQIDYILHLADNALILGQRNSEWCGHGPVLEQDIAITNISLDLIGQARWLYQYAANLINTTHESNGMHSHPLKGPGEVTEDSLAYLRTEREFKNCLLTELPNGDWAQTILRQYFLSEYQFLLFQQLQNNNDEQLAGFAAKTLKEVTYHLRWSREWVIRLGDGTEESHRRLHAAFESLWPYTGELFMPAPYESNNGIDLIALQRNWESNTATVLSEATVTNALPATYMYSGGKTGVHTEHMGFILAEMQYLQRSYPGCEW
jgi:ring-1,2-phenylacetyl-CoA epoxidase subunit PaaC